MDTPAERLERIAQGMAAASAGAAFFMVPVALWVSLEGVLTFAVLASMVGCGFWLLNGYLNVQRGGTRPPWFWWASAVFNGLGALYLGSALALLFSSFYPLSIVLGIAFLWTATMVGLSLWAAQLTREIAKSDGAAD